MTQEALLVKTKDNYVIVFNINYSNIAEKRRLSLQCENICSAHMYQDVVQYLPNNSNIEYDSPNTNFLHSEISGYDYLKNRAEYYNGLQTNDFPNLVKEKNTLHFDDKFDDSLVPEMIKNIGFRIEPVDKLVDVIYDEKNHKYTFPRQNNMTLAQVQRATRKIDIMRYHFRFPPKDFERLKKLINDFKNSGISNPGEYLDKYISDNKDRSLFQIYASRIEQIESRRETITHEFKHIKNAIFIAGLSLKKDAKRLSVEDYYRVEVENERSAYLNTTINSINSYLKGGNLSDYSMFYSEDEKLVNKLKKMSEEDRLAYVSNMQNIMRYSFDKFKRDKQHYYDTNQFNTNLKADIQNAPLEAEVDTDRKEFYKIQSLMYNYEVYNPYTKRMEYHSLANLITPEMQVEITPEAQSFIATQKQKLQDRIANHNLQKNRGDINPDLIAPAKALMRTSLKDSAFVGTVDNLKVIELAEGYEPAPHIPNDNIKWSDGLQKYWQKIEGYQELARNNAEYSFKIKDTTLRYTKQNEVSVAPNADYELYDKLLKEPTNANRPVEFLNTLSKQQALTLYIVCINNGRKPVGAVPTDFSELKNLQGIPPEAINKFRHRMNGQNQNPRQANVATNFRTQQMSVSR